MQKKRILVCSHWLRIGGAERALLGLLQHLGESEHEVDLFLCSHTGELFSFIPDHVNLLPEDNNAACIAIPAKGALARGAVLVVFGRLWAKIRAKIYERRNNHPNNSNVAIEYSHLYTHRFVRKIKNNPPYDIVLSFLEPHYIPAFRVEAKCKVAWMHTDYSTISVDVKKGLEVWSQFDYIAAISERCAEAFSGVYPMLKDRIIVIENTFNTHIIEKQSAEFCPISEMPDGPIKLLSIGRYCTAKNFDNVPDICARIRRAGLDIRWYIIGFGADETLIRQKIMDAGMQEYVILLGKKNNPYPYIKACDLYVQPSRYEGNCVTVHEAQILGKPVVITKYATSASQLEDGVDGVIVPMDNEGCADGIIRLLHDSQRMHQLSANCKARDYSNSNEINKLYGLLNEKEL